MQISRLERGEKALIQGKLFEQATFKEALPSVSKVRLEQTLFAEYPAQKPFIEALNEHKATQPLSSLARIWQVEGDAAMREATTLEEIGFFERIGAAAEPTWRVPFLYRPALALVQGSAEGVEI